MIEVDPLAVGLRGFKVREVVIPILHKYALPWEMIVAHKRACHLIAPRQEIMYVLRMAGFSFGKIAIICDRDHATIMYGVKKHKERELERHS
jgi:chromosomal replication initiation ATPase DnaA